ncbi:MAG: TonB-dependent receptor [Prevotella sp.]
MRTVYFLFIYIILLLTTTPASAQITARARVVDQQTGDALPGAWVRLANNFRKGAVTDAEGYFTLQADTNAAVIAISYLGYKDLKAKLVNNAIYRLNLATNRLIEVVVTATERRGLTSSSVIGKHAMQHLQPSSFTDLLELLPGGMAKDPSLTTPNIITLREVGRPSSKYNTSSLGTRFIIDGAPISTNADMQFMNGAWDSRTTYRDFTNSGVDMRSISTDDVEQVEVVRGIPGVEYGDLTSGLVKIQRGRGGHNLRARFKADMESKLLHVSKGFEWDGQRWTLNLSADWLNAKGDPRNVLETYQRLTFSVRGGHRWQTVRRQWDATLNMDYSGSFDDDKTDPELNYGGVDAYRSDRNRWAANFTLRQTSKHNTDWWRSAEFLASVNFEKDMLDRQRLVQIDHGQPAAVTKKEGESQAVLIYPYKYTGRHRVDGRPLGIFMKVQADFSIPSSWMSNKLKVGTDWQLDKNLGKGQLFDPMFPLYTGISTRQRKYSDVPAEVQQSNFAEADITLPFGNQQLQLVAGLRSSMMMNLSNRYDLHGKIYLDPRVNVGWNLPPIGAGYSALNLQLRGGWGKHTKMPTIDQLFPELLYIDMVEMNYWHAKRELRSVWLQTYIKDPTNWHLRAARNEKWELSVDASWRGHRFTLTYFEEDMKSGFRHMSDYHPYSYKWYDTSGIDHNNLTAAPDPATLPYEVRHVLRSTGQTSNGSRTLKRGVEYTYSSPRWQLLATRLTVTGAWLKSQYRNSIVMQEHVSRRVGGRELELVGLYNDDDGYIREMWNTNFTFDTDVPRLALGFSLSAQCMWYTARQNMHKEVKPISYMTADGTLHPFTEADAKDVERQFLVRTYNSSIEKRQTVPFYMNLNLKVTKRLLSNRLMAALFVNKIFDLHPDYTRNNYTTRRYVTPYFGLELNFNL